MAVYKEERTNTWRVIYRYTDWNGERKQSQKRGFPTKREAQAWEREQLNQKAGDPDMTFASFVELYKADIRHQVNENTMQTKEHIIRTKLVPYFGRRRLSEIMSKDVMKWQNEMIDHRDEKGRPYSPVYLSSLNAQLNAILNHAVKHYKLKGNPTNSVRSMGRKQNREKAFWTKEEYLKFAEVMMDKPVAFYAFEMLYWCGIREGELLALTPSDFDLEKGTVSITKSYQRIKGRDVIGPPKTEKGNRVIRMPDFLVDEMRDYLRMLYDVGLNDRMFTITKGFLHREMDRGSREADVRRIRIHDLRHSHVSLLIDMGFSAVAIAECVGHESIDITYRYVHMFLTIQNDIATKLNMQRLEKGC